MIFNRGETVRYNVRRDILITKRGKYDVNLILEDLGLDSSATKTSVAGALAERGVNVKIFEKKGPPWLKRDEETFKKNALVGGNVEGCGRISFAVKR